MCTLCSASQNFDPSRHAEGEPAFAALSESSDAAAGTQTSYEMSVGDSFNGTIGSAGDEDWIEISLEAGESYTFAVEGTESGHSLDDPYLQLQDAQGAYVAYSDDASAATLEPSLTYTATSSGTYYINVRGYDEDERGTYRLTTEASSTAAPDGDAGTLDEMATYLISGYWGTAHSFDTSSSNVITVNLSALTSEGQQLARWALQAWETVANLDFVEVRSGGDITFDDNQSGAFAGASFTSTGTTLSANVNVSSSWISSYGSGITSYTMSTYVHEIGHALGLGHQGNYNGNANYASDATFSNDSYQLSVMSYFPQDENPTVDADYADPISAMMVDIIAMQQLYGAPGENSPTAGNTTWGEGSTLGTYMDQLFANGTLPDDPVAITIYDAGGTDLINFASLSVGANIDLNPESYSDVGLVGNIAIARGTYIENVTLGTGDDTVTGNVLGNTITTGGGGDTVDAGDGDDRIWLGDGNDSAEGGAGDDRIGGMAGADEISGDAGDDILWGGGENDLLNGGADNDALYGDTGHDTLWAGTGDDTLFGGNHNDRLEGESGHDEINGELGNDALRGGAGFDTLNGGEGNDWLDGGNWGDTLNGGDGSDGLWGAQGNDVMDGGAGDDRLWFGVGDDTVTGGADADTFSFFRYSGNDVITDLNGAEGDVVRLHSNLWASSGALTEAQMLAQFASLDGSGNVVLGFDTGDSLTLTGITSLDGLGAVVEII